MQWSGYNERICKRWNDRGEERVEKKRKERSQDEEKRSGWVVVASLD
jgi:hypothetical protein